MNLLSISKTMTAALLAGLLLSGGANAGFRGETLLVMPAAGLSDESFDKVLKKANKGAKSKRKLRGSKVHMVQVPPKSEKAIAKWLAKHPNIAFAELDELVPPDAVNDPSYSKQWHLPKMGAEAAWNTSNGQGVIVAVLDTGVNPNHADLSGQVLPGWNTVSNNTDTADIHNHGTWVAGVIAAKVNNFTGGASVAPGTKILPIRISNRSDGAAYFSDMAEGITWAADNGARVANLSFGGAAGSATIANAATTMMNKGGVVVVAAGNDNTDYGYMNHASLYVAGATTGSDTKASFSSYGNFVDISAPGTSIFTTSRGGGYSTVQGTSFASPNAAAVAALVMAANPALLPTDVLAVLSNSAVDLGGAGWDPVFGYGRVDAQAAVEMAASVETSDTLAPQVGVVDPLANATVSGIVDVEVEATDAFGVSRVELLVDGQVIAEEMQSLGGNKYGFAWETGNGNDGQYTLSARAFDAAGNRGVANGRQVQVVNTADEEPPTVWITSPTSTSSNGARSVTLAASASDNVGVTQISMYDGNKLICSATNNVSCNWNLKKVASGAHTIRAVAKDAAGNQGESAMTYTVGSSNTDDGGSTSPGKGRGKKK